MGIINTKANIAEDFFFLEENENVYPPSLISLFMVYKFPSKKVTIFYKPS